MRQKIVIKYRPWSWLYPECKVTKKTVTEWLKQNVSFPMINQRLIFQTNLRALYRLRVLVNNSQWIIISKLSLKLSHPSASYVPSIREVSRFLIMHFCNSFSLFKFWICILSCALILRNKLLVCYNPLYLYQLI